MEKIIVEAEVAEALEREGMGAPAPWVLALVARVKKKAERRRLQAGSCSSG
jgi:hypothetical protein